MSVPVAIIVCIPTLRVPGLKLHAPAPSAVALPSTVLPSVSVTTMFGAVMPVSTDVSVLGVMVKTVPAPPAPPPEVMPNRVPLASAITLP